MFICQTEFSSSLQGFTINPYTFDKFVDSILKVLFQTRKFGSWIPRQVVSAFSFLDSVSFIVIDKSRNTQMCIALVGNHEFTVEPLGSPLLVDVDIDIGIVWVLILHFFFLLLLFFFRKRSFGIKENPQIVWTIFLNQLNLYSMIFDSPPLVLEEVLVLTEILNIGFLVSDLILDSLFQFRGGLNNSKVEFRLLGESKSESFRDSWNPEHGSDGCFKHNYYL